MRQLIKRIEEGKRGNDPSVIKAAQMEAELKKAGYKVSRGIDELTVIGKSSGGAPDKVMLYWNNDSKKWQVTVEVGENVKDSDAKTLMKNAMKIGFKK